MNDLVVIARIFDPSVREDHAPAGHEFVSIDYPMEIVHHQEFVLR